VDEHCHRLHADPDHARQRLDHALQAIQGRPRPFHSLPCSPAGGLRCAGHVERIDADHWKVPGDIAERDMAYDTPSRPKDFSIRTLSTLDLEREVNNGVATWLDREVVAKDHLSLAEIAVACEDKFTRGSADQSPRDGKDVRY
jgi:hypothetical protein